MVEVEEMISVIVPAYKESPLVEPCIKILTEEMEKIKKEIKENYEIILSAEGDDDTPQIMKHLMKKYKNLKFVYSKQKLGKGGGIEHGLTKAKGEKIIFMDVDLSVHPSYAKEMIKLIDRYDIVVASRYTPLSKVKRSGTRIFLGYCYSMFIRILLRIGVRDAQCGFKAYKRNVLKDCTRYVKNKNVFWDTELLFMAKCLKYKVGEIPVHWEEREGKSNISTTQGIFGVLPYILELFIRSWFKKNKPTTNQTFS